MINYWERNVIPKWRRSSVAATLPETRSSVGNKKIIPNSKVSLDFLTNELSLWKQNKSIGVAADLLNFSHIQEANSLLEDPANFVLKSQEKLPDPLIFLANKVLNERVKVRDVKPSVIVSPEKIFEEIAYLKKRLSYNPRDAITLVDLARLYASLGQKEKADKAITTATSIYPDHRFILRSSTRHWIHSGDPEKGLHLLRKTERTKTDPWLLASELAVESVLKKSPKRWNLAKSILASDKFDSVHIAELASASASMFLQDGKIKDAKRLFNKALLDPNDNVIAQAIWASNFFGINIKTRPEWFEGAFSAEANYYKKQSELDFKGAIEAALEWFYSEPFSLRPLRAATYAACIIENFEDAEKFAKLGLNIDKNDIELGNNLVYALVGQGKIDEAVILLQEIYIYEKNETGSSSYHTIANFALIHYRFGFTDEAEKLYRASLSLMQEGSHSESRAVATATMAKEAKLANAPNSAQLLAEAKALALSTKASGALKIIEILTNTTLLESKYLDSQIPRWIHDKSTNTLLITPDTPFKVR